MQCMSVDLPDPEGPMIPVNRLGAKSIDTERNAVTAVGPLP